MAEEMEAGMYEAVTICDRACTGGCEFKYNAVDYVFKPGQVQRTVPRFVAQHLFSVDKGMVRTTTGELVRRFAVVDGPEDFLEGLGPEDKDSSPIEIDPTAVEGWNAEAQRGDAKVEVKTLRTRREDFAHQGSARSGTFSGKERGSTP